jgi:3-methylcrotonyl-CoA carboxylase beta subunit
MTEGSGLYLAGPALVRAAIGQVVDSEELGGARMHATVAGTADYREPDDQSAIARLRSLAGTYADRPLAGWAARRTNATPPTADPSGLLDLMSPDASRPYEVRDLIARVVDGAGWSEFKAEYGETLVTGFARVGGYPVGVVANQRAVIRKKDRIEVGGVIYGEAADKAARFILNANQAGVPLVFLSDVTGFMVGRDSEQSGIIRRGAKMVNAVANSVVPKITVITGGSYGAGNYAMAGKAYGPRFIYAWPSARYAVMSGNAAAKTLLDIQVAQLERAGHKPDDEELKRLYDEVKAKYDTELDPRYAASRLWVDEIISPLDTRARIIRSLDVCSLNAEREELRVGVFQV